MFKLEKGIKPITRVGGSQEIFNIKFFKGLKSLVLYVNNLQNNNVYNEILTGAIDGINTDFTTSFNFVLNTSRVFKRGQRLVLGASYDYIELTSNTIRFNTAPFIGGILTIDYDKL